MNGPAPSKAPATERHPGGPPHDLAANALGTQAAPAWSSADLAANPHQDPQKADRVQRMFAAIAARYDLNNRLHSFGLDQHWRRRAVDAVAPVAGMRVLDVACGTGDLSMAFAAAGALEVIGVDFTEPMLAIARAKAARSHRRGAARVRTDGPAGTEPTGDDHGHSGAADSPLRFQFGDAMALDFPDQRFDRVSIAFGLRNVADPAKALREFRRVLRPGGRVVILEFDEPRMPVVRQLSRFYTRVIMPWTATIISRDRSGAYHYLPKSVETFHTRESLAAMLVECGFRVEAQRPLSGGIAMVTVAASQAGI